MPVTGPAALDEQPRRRRAVLLAAPWVLAATLAVAALISRPGASAAPAGGAATPSPAPAESAPAESAPAESAPNAVATAGVAPDPAAPLPSGALPATTHLQVLAQARAALGTAGLATDDRPRTDRWPIEVRLAEVASVTDTLAIATVHALVIELVDDGWAGPVARAVAVPLTTSPEPRVAGPAWPITAPPMAVDAPDGQAIADPDPSVLGPLEQAGWTVDELTAVELVGGAVLRLRFVGSPPDGQTRGDHVVWLLDAPGGPRLLPLETAHTPQEST